MPSSKKTPAKSVGRSAKGSEAQANGATGNATTARRTKRPKSASRESSGGRNGAARKASASRKKAQRAGAPNGRNGGGKPRSPSASAKAGRFRLWWWIKLSLVLGLLTAIGLTIYGLYLDRQVRAQFEGKRWALPAQVYARPLELYPGAAVSQADVERELRMLGYRHHAVATTTGTYGKSGTRLAINTRAFRFWDGDEPEQRVHAAFSDSRLVRLTDARGVALDLIRLDPLHIGGIYPKHLEDRVLVRLNDVPKRLTDVLVEVEDRAFYEHHGVSPKGILRAALVNLRAGGVVQGGSTLTQQLVKNFYLSSERSLLRKLNEALMALSLEWHYTKEEILEAYLNEVYLGQAGGRAIHGFGLGSWFYFSRPLNELNVEHVALLVGLVKGPSFYNPRRHPERAKQRRDVVLDVMVERGLIAASSAAAAKSRPLGVSKSVPSGRTRYPAYLDLVRRQLKRDYRDEDLRSEGLRIFTNLDPIVQHHAERAVAGRVRYLEKRYQLEEGKLQAASVVTTTEGGAVLALVSGRDPAYAGFNRALDARRQIGSLIKPVVYLAALAKGGEFSLATLLSDAPVSIKIPGDARAWEPKNASGRFYGPVLLRDALVHSYNLATVDLSQRLGLDPVLSLINRLGVERQFKPYPSLVLGAQAMSPLEVAQIYQTLAAGGYRTPLTTIREVLSTDGQPVQRFGLEVRRAVDSKAVFLINDTLQAVTREGTARYLQAMLSDGTGFAGKTGTTDDLRDSWFAGFSGDRLAVVWLGMDDYSPTRLTGSSGALLVFGDLMKRLRPQSLKLYPPPGVEELWVSRKTGLLASPDCAGAVRLPFMKDSGPIRTDACAIGLSGASSSPRSSSTPLTDDDGGEAASFWDDNPFLNTD